MGATKDFYWFGIKRLDIAAYPTAPNTTPTWVHVPSIEEATLRSEISEVKAYGDGSAQYTFYHSPNMSAAVKLTKFSGLVAEMLSGNTAATVSGNERLHIMTNHDMSPQQVMLRLTIPARDDDTGLPRDLTLIFFKVTARPIWDGFGGAREKATELNWTFDALASTQDERGNPLPAGIEFAFGRYDFPVS